MANLKLLAVKIGDELKYDTTLKEIDRIADAIFDFDCLKFPQDNITSERAQLVYDWLMTLNKQEISDEEKISLLNDFIDGIAPEDHSVRRFLNKKNSKKECKNLIKELEIAIIDIKESLRLIVKADFFKGKEKYLESYTLIETLINKLNDECNFDFIHSNPHETEMSVMADMGANKITSDNLDGYIDNLYGPLESSIRSIKTGKHEEVPKQNITHVNVNGNIENFASGDINNYNITLYLSALKKVIEDSSNIPPEEKRNLIEKIKDVAKNPYVSSISSSLIIESIKALSTGFKPF
jgi:hypothetical protein